MKIHSGRDAVAFLGGEIDAVQTNIICPNCRSDYTPVYHVGTPGRQFTDAWPDHVCAGAVNGEPLTDPPWPRCFESVRDARKCDEATHVVEEWGRRRSAALEATASAH